MKLRGNVIFAGVIAAIFIAATLMSLGLSPKARLLPLIVGIPGTLLSLIATMKELRSTAIDTQRFASIPRDEIAAIAWIAGFWLAILLCGFIVGAPIASTVYFALALRKGPLWSIAAGLSCWLLTYGLFERIFNVPLFGGLLLS